MSRPDANGQDAEELEFEQELTTVERSLETLKTRYVQIQQDQESQTQLLEQQERLKQQYKQRPTTALKAELKKIQDQLDELEGRLESQLLTWKTLQGVLWQIVRFGGLGILIGWFLAFAVLQAPAPTPTPTEPREGLVK